MKNKKLRFLLDTNVVIPSNDFSHVLNESLANLRKWINGFGHKMIIHKATYDDINRDRNEERKNRMLSRLKEYEVFDDKHLENPCPWNEEGTKPNDACDNRILYAIECSAAHALVTEDKGIHAKAHARNLQDKVYTIQTAETWLRRLHFIDSVTLPNISDTPISSLTPELEQDFFYSLKADYPEFNKWFRNKAMEGRRAWIYRDNDRCLQAICIYQIKKDEVINNANEKLPGKSLKLCTFKVAEVSRGYKIGELFLKAAFQYATNNNLENIFITAKEQGQEFLIRFLRDFGFVDGGSYGPDIVLIKKHPIDKPQVNGISPLEYMVRYFPHYMDDDEVGKFIVPIMPEYHTILFPEYKALQPELFTHHRDAGNAIKKAYISHAKIKSIKEGDILIFYRSKDEMAITSLGIVEGFYCCEKGDATKIASLVSRRTVYDFSEIVKLSEKETKVILFRLIRHFSKSIPWHFLTKNGLEKGTIQTTRQTNEKTYSKIIEYHE